MGSISKHKQKEELVSHFACYGGDPFEFRFFIKFEINILHGNNNKFQSVSRAALERSLKV